MLKIFRNIRQNLIIENKTSKYLKYAIGEIVLVVIGILIALQINNFNDNRNSEEELIYALDKISIDLNRDINFLNNIILDGNKLDSLAKIIINKSYELNVMAVPEKINLFYTGLQYSPFSYASSGYDKFNKLKGSIPNEYNEVIEQINMHYNSFAPLLMKLNEKQSDEIESHHTFLAQNETWYSQFRLGKFTKEAEDFFTKDPVYLNWITQYKISNSSKKYGILHALRGSSIATLLKVNKSLGKSNKNIAKFIQKVPEKFSSIAGSYSLGNEDTFYKVEIIDGYLLMDGMVYNYEKEIEFKSFGFGNKLKFTLENDSYKLYTYDFFKNIEAVQQK